MMADRGFLGATRALVLTALCFTGLYVGWAASKAAEQPGQTLAQVASTPDADPASGSRSQGSGQSDHASATPGATAQTQSSEPVAAEPGASSQHASSAVAAGHGNVERAHSAEAGHGDGHHDPYDLTHANASEGLTNVRELRFDQMLGTWLVFLLLVAGLGKLAWKPIVHGLEKREQSIAAKIEEAERKEQAAAELLREYQQRLAQAAEEGRALIAKAQQEAERKSAEILNAAQEAAQRELARARAEIQAAQTAALEQLAKRSAEMAISIASRILHRQLAPEDHRQLIGEALEQFTTHN